MAGFGGLLGHLAGGYADAAEQENRRQFEAEQSAKQNALGMVKMLIENPATPPEYKGILAQHGMDIIHTPHGKKLPSTDKMMASLPALPGKPNIQPNPAMQTSTAMTLPGPQPPPGLPDGMAGPAQLGAGLPASGPLQIPGAVIRPPAPAPAANIANAGQFHMMSQAEMGEQQGQAAAAQIRAEISALKQQGFTDEQIGMKLGMSKLAPIPFGGLYNTSTGETIMPGNTPMTKVQYMVNGQGPFFGFTSRAGGPIMDANNQPVPNATPFVPSAMDTTTTGEFHYVDADGNVHATPTTSTKHKMMPGGARPGAVAAPPVPPGVPGASSASSTSPASTTPNSRGNRIISGNAPKATALDTSIQKDAIKASQTARTQINLLDSAETYIKKGEFDSAGDLSLLVQAVRAMNPGTVRLPVQEIQMEAHRGTYGDNFRRWFDTKVASGTLPNDQREQLIGVMRRETEQVGADAAQNWEQSMKGKPLPPHLKRFATANDTNTGGGGHVIEIGGKHYQYKGSGATDDMKNYTEVPAQ